MKPLIGLLPARNRFNAHEPQQGRKFCRSDTFVDNQLGGGALNVLCTRFLVYETDGSGANRLHLL
jgi:hypothetical protein